jgi:SlyX protein
VNETIRHLEEKIAYLEHHVTAQDKVMLELGEEIARLKRDVALLAGRVTSGSGAAGEPPIESDERPPHY